MYNKQEWKDEIPDLTKPIMDPSTGKQKTDPQTGRPLFELVQVGTRITSTRLNTMESGIEAAHTLVEQLAKELGGNFVVSADGVMGLACSAQGLKVTWTAGIAYVSGRRYQVPAGEMALNPTQGQYVYVDVDGVVKKTTSQATAKKGLTIFYVATDTSGVISTTDHRVNIRLEEILKRLENVQIPDASLTEKGKVQLDNATDSTNDTTASTPRAVNAAKQEAINAAKANDEEVILPQANASAQGYANAAVLPIIGADNPNIIKNSAAQFGLHGWVPGVPSAWTIGSMNERGFRPFSCDIVSSSQYAILESQPFAIAAGAYNLQALFNSLGASGSTIKLYVEIVNSANNNNVGTLFADTNKTWHRKNALITIPTGVTSAKVRLVVYGGIAGWSFGSREISRIKLSFGSSDVPYTAEADDLALLEYRNKMRSWGAL
ncbi:hypothetical protein DC345_19825 [Paenibacillus taichungensis]|uniref:Tail fiber-like repeat protein n=1 Tax=Paenibacillus taichungensis TaxID=484184 RepID=A0A329QMY0_9BACL|nr:phage tail protein [Paenibacillus taichungensis]RAW13593.1 hypothetical protein DC345_19825 [Paenibacillus taichungensis]